MKPVAFRHNNSLVWSGLVLALVWVWFLFRFVFVSCPYGPFAVFGRVYVRVSVYTSVCVLRLGIGNEDFW